MKNVHCNSFIGHHSIIVFFLLFTCFSQTVSAQRIDSSHIRDSLKTLAADTNSLVEKVRRFGEKEIKQSMQEFKEDLNAIKQQELLEAIKKETFEARDFVKKGLDTANLIKEVNEIRHWYDISSDGIFTNTGSIQTYRNLATSKIVVNELIKRLSNRKAELDAYNKRLLTFRNQIDSFATDSSLFMVPSDSENVIHYFNKLITAGREIAPADSVLKKAVLNSQELQTTLNVLLNTLTARLESIENYQEQLSGETFKRDVPNLGDSIAFDRSLKDILYFAALKGCLALYFYVQNNDGKIFSLLLLTLLCFIFLRSLKNHLKEDNHLREDKAGQLILRYPMLSAIMIIFSIFQFIFIQPPFIFNFILWTASGFALTFIFNGFITKYWMRAWLAFFFFFLLGSALNLVLQASRTERWIMLGVSIAGFIVTAYIVIIGRKEEIKEKWIVYFIALAVLMELLSSIYNIYGRYNLSKMLLTTGFFNIIIGITFLWSVRFISEGLVLARNQYTVPEKRLFYINFGRIGDEVPVFFKVLLIVGWFILFGRNFYAFKNLSTPIESFLTKDRIIGSYAFSIKSICLFFGILLIASLISKIVSFFASDRHASSTNTFKGIGSWLLIIRISIISIGLFLAFAAIGIPVDRITVIIGALSVGIGFGLQTLINNLVSGLIISFERLVNVGDIVEIGDRAGTMRSIGFRSSILTTWDGAEVIIPNGDLLNQHLVNWTLIDSTKRIELAVAVAYGTDLEKTKQILTDALGKDERIMQLPAPMVQAKEFNNSSIDFQLYFWARNIRESGAIKADMLLAIDKVFKQNNITIPFPQQDIYIHTEKKSKDAES